MTATRRAPLAAALAAAALLALTGCSGSSSDDSSTSGGSAGSGADVAASAPEAASDAGGSGASAERAADVAPQQQAVIATGTVELRAEDVGAAADDVRAVAATYGGTLAQDTTSTDDDGEVDHARLVLRVPTARFEDALQDLTGLGTLVSSDSSTEDVTTQVVDTDARVESQKRSIARIQALFDQAVDLDDVVRLEGELASRQADLTSLEQQQAYLADQTSLSTISVGVARTTTAPPEADDDDTGFLAGLSAGWSGLRGFGTAAATVVGALLPWSIVLALLGLPLWALVRRSRRRVLPS